MHEPTDYLTTAEAAAVLRLSPITLCQWRSRDCGPPYVKIGAAVRYRRGDLDAWAEERKVACGAA